jgi:hypothetical protein
MHKLKKLLAGVVLAGATVTPLVLMGSPAEASSPCNPPANQLDVMGAYVQTYDAGWTRSSCITVDWPTRQASNKITLRGTIKDTATDGHVAVVTAQFRVGGAWGSPKVIAWDGSEAWRSWSYPVTTLARVDAVRVNACRMNSAGATSDCRSVPLELSGF